MGQEYKASLVVVETNLRRDLAQVQASPQQQAWLRPKLIEARTETGRPVAFRRGLTSQAAQWAGAPGSLSLTAAHLPKQQQRQRREALKQASRFHSPAASLFARAGAQMSSSSHSMQARLRVQVRPVRSPLHAHPAYLSEATLFLPTPHASATSARHSAIHQLLMQALTLVPGVDSVHA